MASHPWVVGVLVNGRDQVYVFDTEREAMAFAAEQRRLGLECHSWEM